MKQTQCTDIKTIQGEPTRKVAVYTAYGEPFSEMRDTLERLGVPFVSRKSEHYADGAKIYYIARVTKKQYNILFDCGEETGGFVEVIK